MDCFHLFTVSYRNVILLWPEKNCSFLSLRISSLWFLNKHWNSHSFSINGKIHPKAKRTFWSTVNIQKQFTVYTPYVIQFSYPSETQLRNIFLTLLWLRPHSQTCHYQLSHCRCAFTVYCLNSEMSLWIQRKQCIKFMIKNYACTHQTQTFTYLWAQIQTFYHLRCFQALM